MTRKSVIIAIPDTQKRRELAHNVNALQDFSVVARTADLMQTFAEVEEKLPTAVLISDVLAQEAEFEVMRALFREMDIRWLVVESGRVARGATPRRGSDLFCLQSDATGRQLESHLRGVTRSDVMRRDATTQAPHATQADTEFNKVILIGSSTGGIDALLAVLSHFPPDCPPTVIVQHTGAGFGTSLANLLNRQCRARVTLAEGEHTLGRGQILIAAGLRAHVELKPRKPIRTEQLDGAPISGHLPSVDALFHSAVPLGSRVVAALLTGMGRDGAEGLKALRNAGARTFAQDEATSVVYGMPKAAQELGAADKSLPLGEIGPALLAAARGR